MIEHLGKVIKLEKKVVFQVELSTHATQDRELDLVRGNIMELLLKIEQPLYINKRNRQDRLGIE